MRGQAPNLLRGGQSQQGAEPAPGPLARRSRAPGSHRVAFVCRGGEGTGHREKRAEKKPHDLGPHAEESAAQDRAA
eukprot:scaffold620_cov282-Pinguiococcus_pyrenoidosus.AAC.2